MPEVPAVSRIAELTEAAVEAFSSDGPLARALDGFEPRAGQVEMAEAVASVLATGGVLLAEAGTGTGKTLAYLVPAILSRKRVLVSTGTKNLQEQIFFKDLPVLREALGIPFTATCMKGRGNYLCLHRFEAFRESPAIRSYDETLHVRILERWVKDTETGDRAEVEDLPEDLPFWNDIAATTENCIGADCPRYGDCFVVKMRQRAAESDIVIVNHHLLCADAAVRQSNFGEVIPRCSNAIVDEAHQLEDVATQYFGLSVSSYRVDDVVRDVDRAIGARLIADGERRQQIADDTQPNPGRGATVLFGAADAQVRNPVSTGSRESHSREGVRPRPSLGRRRSARRGARGPRGRCRVDQGRSRRRAGTRTPRRRDQRRPLVSASCRRCRLRVLSRDSRPRRLSQSVADRRVVDDPRSAARSDGRDGADLRDSHRRRRVRLRQGASRRRARDGSASSPRSSTTRARPSSTCPRASPTRADPEFAAAAAREIVSILKLTSGRAFVLFTSYANLREVHRLASAELEYPILVQGTAPRSALLRDFKATPHAVLLATSSFWQGVDVVGEALSCVIIDKLPFASPGDPVTAARVEAIGARGGSPFGEYQIPLAILALKQGLGRLLRHRQDRGVLAVLDPRLKTMGYGRRFLASLPPAPVTHDLFDIARFFGATAEDDAAV